MATKIIFRILFILDLVVTGALAWAIYRTELLSTQLVILAAGLLLLLPLLLYWMQREKKDQNKKKGLRIALIVLLLFLVILEGAGFYFLNGYNRSMDVVTDGRTQVTRMTVYVKEDDLAQTMEYAVERQYVFGTLSFADEEAVAHTQSRIESKYGKRITVKAYPSLLDLITALENGEVNALLISSGYLDLMEELPEEYAGYANQLRTLMESEVTTEIAVPIIQQNEEIDEETALTLMSPELWENSFVVYISGIDTRGGAVTSSANSDVNILAVVNTETKTVLLISTPRDYYVPFGYLDNHLDKLTHAGYKGIDGSMQVVGDYYGLPIDYYLRVNFAGFVNIIDALGGVDVDSDAAFTSAGYHYQKGINHLDGRAALRFVRERHVFADGDRARGRHQMAVIKGVIKGLVSFQALSNYSQIMDELAGSFLTNAPKSLVGDMVRLTLDTEKGKWKVLTYSVNGYDRMDHSYSLGFIVYVMFPNTNTVEYARQLIITVATGEPLTQTEINSNAPGQ